MRENEKTSAREHTLGNSARAVVVRLKTPSMEQCVTKGTPSRSSTPSIPNETVSGANSTMNASSIDTMSNNVSTTTENAWANGAPKLSTDASAAVPEQLPSSPAVSVVDPSGAELVGQVM